MKEKLAYRYFSSMSDEERNSESEFYYPKDEEQAKTEQNNMSKVITHEDENFGNNQEELQKFVQKQKSENTVIKNLSDTKGFGLINTTSNDLLRAQADAANYFRPCNK